MAGKAVRELPSQQRGLLTGIHSQHGPARIALGAGVHAFTHVPAGSNVLDHALMALPEGGTFRLVVSAMIPLRFSTQDFSLTIVGGKYAASCELARTSAH